jgi:dihydropyrimidinase
MSPPIRSRTHNAAIRAALAGGQLQLLGTDHAVFNSTQKAAGKNDFRIIPNGVNGIEERLHVAWHELVNTGLIAPTDFVRITSTAAAQIFNIYPKKGVIAQGSDADVILFDPSKEHTISAATHHSAMDTNVYEGKIVRGKVTTTISRGKVVWHEGKLNVERGSGQYVPLPTGGPLFAGLDARDASIKSVYGEAPVDREEAATEEKKVKDEL